MWFSTAASSPAALMRAVSMFETRKQLDFQMGLFGRVLAGNQEEVSSVSKTHIKKLGMMVHIGNLRA